MEGGTEEVRELMSEGGKGKERGEGRKEGEGKRE